MTTGRQPGSEVLDIDYEILSKALELVANGDVASAVIQSSESVASFFVEVRSVYEIDLEALASNLHFGWTDPIGEIQKWFYDRLVEISSIFSSTVDTLIKPVKTVVDSILSFVRGIPDAVIGGVSSLIDAIKGGINSLATLLSDVLKILQNIGSTIAKSVSGFFDTLWSNIQSAFSEVSKGISSIISKISDSISSVIQTLSNVASNIVSSVSKVASTIGDSLSKIGESIWSGIQTLSKGLLDALGKVWDFLQNIGKIIYDNVKGFVDWLWSGIQSVGKMIYDGVKGFVDWLWNGIQSVIGGIIDIAGRIWNFLLGVGKVVADAISGFFDWLWKGIQGLVSGIVDIAGRIWGFLQSIGKIIYDNIKGFIDWLWSGIQSGLQGVIKFFEGIGSKIMSTLTSAWDMVMSGISTVGNALADLGIRLWSYLEGLGTTLLNALSNLTKSLADFAKYVYNFGAQVMGGISSISGFIQGLGNFLINLPNTIQNMFKSVVDFFGKLGEQLAQFIKNPAEWFKNNVLDPLWNGILLVGEKLVEGLKKLWEYISKGLSWLWDALVGGVKTLVDLAGKGLSAVAGAVGGLVDSLVKGVKGVGSSLYKVMVDAIEWVIKPSSPDPISEATARLGAPLSDIWSKLWSRKIPGLDAGAFLGALTESLNVMVLFMIAGVMMILPVRGAGFALKSAGNYIESLRGRLSAKASPIGLGIEIDADLLGALGSTIRVIGEELERNSDRFVEPLVMGMGMWYGMWMTRILSYRIRNFIPVEMPSYREVGESYLKAMVADKVPSYLVSKPSELASTMVDFLRMRGYSDFLLAYGFASPEDFYFEIVDRFGTKRKIPLADVWKIPPPTDVVRMMIRDIIINPDQFKKIMKAVGYYEDVASMYFLLHFRYPPPERLAEFYWRGVTGFLWFSETLEEESIKTAVGANKKATPPRDLNFNSEKLNKMLHYYMKWHDYAPFAWEDGFPTDKSVVVELMADLPDKADLRWMARWGIFEHLSKLGVGMRTSIEDMIKSAQSARGSEGISSKVSSGIYLDVSLLARMLEARGVHPYLASLVAVADIHVALTDEMTLLRGGFIELFRNGMVDLDTTEQLMSGLFSIQFTTGYIDPASGTPVTYTYNKPIFWLPAERRMLQLRAAMDRAYELFRTAVREISHGVIRLGITPEEAKAKIYEFSNVLMPALSEHVRAITGVDWKPTVDDRYISLWLKYAEIARTIETRNWIRNYSTRVMAWIIYRTSYGWVKTEDFQALTSELRKLGWLTEEEEKYFLTVVDKLAGIVKRETIPTPLTLATMAEYMVIDDATINMVFNDQRVAEEYRPLYMKYIKIKPFKSDYKTLINRAMRALVAGVISKDEWSGYLAKAISNYGFLQDEIDIINEIARLEELIEDARLWHPTPQTLSTISEYVSVPTSILNKVFEEMNIPEEWKSLWMQYVFVKPVKADYKAVISAALRALRYGAISKDQWENIVGKATQYGFTPTELSMIEMRAQLELLVEEARNWRPTILTLISIVEYVPEAVKLLSVYNIDPAFRYVIERYATIKPLADDVRTLMSAYYRAKRYAARYGQAIPEDVEKAVKSYFSMVGITDVEMVVRDLAEYLDVLVDSWRSGEVVPTPSVLATMAEYIELPSDYVTKVLQLRKVETTYAQLWIQYISARTVATEVNRVVTAFTNLFIRYAVPDDIVKTVRELMARGGWTSAELQIFDLELQLRRYFRIFTLLIPTVRGAVGDAYYMPNWESIIEDVFRSYGLSLDQYKKQLEYYKRLAKNRRMWRHFSWYRSQLAYAYQYGALDENGVRKALKKFVDIGLLDPDEVEVVVEGIKIRAAGYATYRSQRI